MCFDEYTYIHASGHRYEGDNFVLDQQVVRAALKAFDALVVKKTRSTSDLTPSTSYLRHLAGSPPSNPSSPLAWDDPQTSVALLEQRAAQIVQERAHRLSDPDASMDQRVSRAVTDAFVAVQVGKIIDALGAELGKKDAATLRKLYTLVRRALRPIHCVQAD